MNKLSTTLENLWTTRRNPVKVIHIIALCLTYPVRSIRAGEPLRRVARRRCLVLLGALCVLGTTPAEAINTRKDINNYKLYAHFKVIDSKEYRCLELLWTRESQWNPRADNPKSTAFGIPQILRMKERDPYRQIDIGLRYIKHRYETACNAWAHHRKTGHY
jgi:hypothetical protein